MSRKEKAGRDFVAACLVAGVAEDSARRLLGAIRLTHRRVALGHISGRAALASVKTLAGRVLA